MGPDPDIYNIKHGFERLDVTGQRLRDSIDLELLRHARRALLPLPLIDPAAATERSLSAVS
jgi:hypothetical protein